MSNFSRWLMGGLSEACPFMFSCEVPRKKLLSAVGLDAPGVQVGSLGNRQYPRNRTILRSILPEGSWRFFSRIVIVIVSTPKTSAPSLWSIPRSSRLVLTWSVLENC